MMSWWLGWSWMDVRHLVWLFALPVIMFLLLRSARRASTRLAMATSASRRGRIEISRGRLFAKSAIFVMVFMSLVIAYAGPRFGYQWIESRGKGMDMVVAVDVSKSMLASDLDPSRLERARRMVLDLMEVAPADRIGLVVFAGEAFVQCPLTVDHDALRIFLDQLSPDLVPIGGTNIASALRESLRALDAGGEGQGKGKIAILLTDGEDHHGNMDAVLSDVSKSGVKVITVGMASASGSPITDPEGGYIQDRQGNVVVSRLDEASLRDIADRTRGYYINASAGLSVADLYQRKLAPSGTARESEIRKEKLWNEMYQWPLGVALTLLVIETLVTEAVLPSAMLIGAIVFLGDARASNAASGDTERYNKAVEHMDAGDQAAAQKEFEELAKSSSGEARRRSLYNLANIYAVAGRLEDAARLYRQALEMNHQDQQVRDNLAWAERATEQKRQDQKSKPDQDQSKDKKNEGQKSDSPPDEKKSQGENDKENQSDKDSGKNDKGSPEPTGKNNKPDGNEPRPDNGEPRGQDLSREEAETLLRAAPDDRKMSVPVTRDQKRDYVPAQEDW